MLNVISDHVSMTSEAIFTCTILSHQKSLLIPAVKCYLSVYKMYSNNYVYIYNTVL